MVFSIYTYGTWQSLSEISETDLRGVQLRHRLPRQERAKGKGCRRAGFAEGPLLSWEPSCHIMHPHHKKKIKIKNKKIAIFLLEYHFLSQIFFFLASKKPHQMKAPTSNRPSENVVLCVRCSCPLMV